MAVAVMTCARCGDAFTASRRHARWCSDRCRIAASRLRNSTPVALWPDGFDLAEHALTEQVRRGEAHPADALLRVVHGWARAGVAT